MKRIFFLLSAISLVLFACKTTKTTTQKPKETAMPKIEWAIFKTGSMGSSETARNIVIKSAAEWQKEWAETNRRFEPVPPAPEIDFSKYWLIGYHLGMRSNGGYSVNIADIQRVNGEIQVSVVEKAPGKNCMSTDMITNPFVYAKIAHFTEAKVSYKTEKVSKDCN